MLRSLPDTAQQQNKTNERNESKQKESFSNFLSNPHVHIYTHRICINILLLRTGKMTRACATDVYNGRDVEHILRTAYAYLGQRMKKSEKVFFFSGVEEPTLLKII